MDYPQTLPVHKTPQYRYDDFILNRGREEVFFTYSFFHDKKYLPVLMHDHDFYEINIIVEGEGMHYIENNRCPAKAGSVFILPPFVKHGYFSKNNDLLIYNLELSRFFMNKYKAELFSLDGYALLFEIEPLLRGRLDDTFLLQLTSTELARIRGEITALVENEHSDYGGINVIKEARTLALIGELTKFAHEFAAQRQDTPTAKKGGELTLDIIKSVSYIHENYSEKITVEKLASLCAMSKISFLRHFKKLFGVTPYEYLIKHRIEAAKNLMREPDKTLSFIAQEVGFYDLSHFERYFIKLEGRSPSAYRKSLRT